MFKMTSQTYFVKFELDYCDWSKLAKLETSVYQLANQLPSKFLALPKLDPEDGGKTFLRNFASHMDYTVLCPRKLQHL
jgi:hypothetical protein